ncbi:MAG: divalent cation tolerance protein CutA [Spirochaetia bacterium]|jgi:hypothetical protein|nr:divalent cation tolerance protein CutA [Spirochaetia bacterium]
MYMLGVYVPKEYLEKVKQALFFAGGGKFGNYDCCCWQTRGEGQFRPLVGSDPFLGTVGKMEKVEEWKLEMIVPEETAEAVIKALKKSHPYEVPAYHLLKMDEIDM